MEIWGHRGASGDAPENTLEAFREAATQGADGVEFDVMRCGSGEIVCCHDERLERLAGLPWEVHRTPLGRLQGADVGSRLGFAPARIPTLDEALAAFAPGLKLNVELKGLGGRDGGLAAQVARQVRARGLADRVVVSSFDRRCLWRVALADPRLRRGCLIDPDRSFTLQARWEAPLLAPWAIHPHHEQVTPDRVKRWHHLGWRVVTWTVDELDEALRVQSAGVDALITNRPGALRRELGAAGR